MRPLPLSLGFPSPRLSRSKDSLSKLLLAVSLCGPLAASAHTVVITVDLEPIEDAMVTSAMPYTNYGHQPSFEISPVWRPFVDYSRESFLKFDLSGIPEGVQVLSARLQATAYDGFAYGGDGSVYAHFVPDDSWSEGSLIWLNKPAISGQALGSWWLWYDFRNGQPRPEQSGSAESAALAAQVQAEVEQDNLLSLRLSSSGYETFYHSSEAADATKRPKLRVRYSAPACSFERPAPTLTVNGSLEMTLECGASTWQDPGASATDACGPVTVERYNSGEDAYGPGPNPNAEGTYSVQYIARNLNGEASAVRTVTVEDTLAPQLTLNGEPEMTHTCGTAFVDPGVTAQDACYGDLTQSVQVFGYVNGWVPGTYTVEYFVTDSGGNAAAPLVRTVTVANCPW
ncbi:protein of unknown function [Stigmatella aurantiaca]|uniref:Uncharacterized protein n=1 Tax=Stigmatella aurantiaca TaxID=41 RepID=A0A1H7LPE6_STIAU|nr:immunoglobulin-like domain-containing protein [Stigmatella aurantiaca]SEL00823.1 protein of unknown function [Stigmatella aurantiaca]